MTETTELQEKIYTELISIHRRLDRLEKLLMPKERLPECTTPEEDATPEEEEALRATPKEYLTEEETFALLDEKPRGRRKRTPSA